MATIQNTNDLLGFLWSQANSGQKNWFSFQQQKVTGIDLAYRIAINHADKMTPEEVVEYVLALNSTIYNKMLKG
jgi:hypothetical protein